MAKAKGIRIEYVKPEDLKPAAYNPREMSEDALQRLADLLDAHGFIDPVIARREDKLLIGGHQRLKANVLRKKPDTEIPCVFLEGVSDAKAKALNIALNNNEAQGVFNPAQLANILVEITDCGFDVPEFTAFDEGEITAILAGVKDFEPVETVDRLDKLDPITCPSCGHEFKPER